MTELQSKTHQEGGCALSRESQKHDIMSHGPYLPHHYGKIFTYGTLITPLSMR